MGAPINGALLREGPHQIKALSFLILRIVFFPYTRLVPTATLFASFISRPEEAASEAKQITGCAKSNPRLNTNATFG
jgi:hypothetical protein